eukprot:672884-Prymnesium_polylepis.1
MALAEASPGEDGAPGLACGPYTIDEMDTLFGPEGWRAMRRFCVIQFRPDGSIKYRPCDDAAESGHNAGTSLGETI